MTDLQSAHDGDTPRRGVDGPLAPTRRRGRSRNTRRPPSGLIPAVPVLAGGAGCDVDASAPVERPYRMGRATRLAITLTVLATVTVVLLNVVLTAAPTPTATVTVSAGDTLWSIAQQVAPDTGVWEVIDDISELNGLTSSTLTPGQQLLVPQG